jgi:hypothetical protein
VTTQRKTVTPCPSCFCITHTIDGKCGKCGVAKSPPPAKQGWEEEYWTFLSALQIEEFSSEVQNKFFDFIRTTRQEAIKAERERIAKTMKEYLDLNTDDMLGTVDVKTFGERMIEYIDALSKEIL